MIDRRIAVVLFAVPLAGCLEPPVSESLDVRVLRGGASVVSIGVVLRDPSDYDKAPRVQQRLESEARDLAEGNDPWSARLRRVEPELQRDIVDRERGGLRRVVRHAQLGAPEDLREFFRDTGVGVAYADGKDWAELTLTPGRTARATAAERQRLDTELAAFSDNLARYAGAMKQLYDYLETSSDRARVCLGEILSVKTEGETLTDGESELVTHVNDAISALGNILDPAPGEPYTLDEISRLVYDPFPAPMRVTVSGEILEREGFPGELKSALQIPVFSIWSAFERLEGRWSAPDPALALWRDDLAKTGKPFDLDAFLAIPRRAAVAPTADEVRAAIENQLKPEPVYRVRWTPAATDDAGLPFDWASPTENRIGPRVRGVRPRDSAVRPGRALAPGKAPNDPPTRGNGAKHDDPALFSWGAVFWALRKAFGAENGLVGSSRRRDRDACRAPGTPEIDENAAKISS